MYNKNFSFQIYFFLIRTIACISIALILTPLLTSCFTGIESTKKVSLSREDKKLSNPTREEKLMAQIEPAPLQNWDMGRSFLVTDNKAMLILQPREGLVPIPPDSIKGKIFEFAGIESKINVAGTPTVTILFSDGIFIYGYDTGKEFEDAMTDIKSDQIPMLIDLEMVAQARNILLNQKLWTKTNLWYDKDGNRINGKKFVEVTVKDIKPGDLVFPLLVEIRTINDESAFIYMNFGSANNESRSFSNLFSLSDIKKHYPNIDPDTWIYISEGRLKEGMTKEEARLSLGNPKNVSSGHDYSQTLDIWNYENGKTLWFEDGKLTRFRQ